MSNRAEPVSCDVKICNERGLHARASAKFVKLANQFESHIQVSKDGQEVCGTSIMGLLLLAAARGETINVSAQGRDADQALGALSELVLNRFEEEK